MKILLAMLFMVPLMMFTGCGTTPMPLLDMGGNPILDADGNPLMVETKKYKPSQIVDIVLIALRVQADLAEELILEWDSSPEDKTDILSKIRFTISTVGTSVRGLLEILEVTGIIPSGTEQVLLDAETTRIDAALNNLKVLE